jgi:hypothetical protein
MTDCCSTRLNTNQMSKYLKDIFVTSAKPSGEIVDLKSWATATVSFCFLLLGGNLYLGPAEDPLPADDQL